MTDEERFPAIDDPGAPGGGMPRAPSMPSGTTAAGDIPISELDLPGPDDPVAWRYIKPGTPVRGSDGSQLGNVETMLGSDQEDIFHGVAVSGGMLGVTRVVSADDIVQMTPSSVDVSLDTDAFANAPEHRPAER